ncbi:hypothetical protein [Niveispirillum sp. BGYR6]|uniref:hypothetical protein n=1 Tax=Niveispirillum sp. BGYR6 TaxID=2971249 RepID=UPI0022B94D6E|nr:hypothetical protein [Niveispirillum sp. BGYR6]MDG5497703.1 hypothetical protein [Niveispirillum sp. BGYR6]
MQIGDRTAQQRVRRYRLAQRQERGMARVEVQVPAGARADIQAIGRRYREARNRLTATAPHLDFALATINAPRPKPIDGETLLQCLLGPSVTAEWRPHIEAFFDELSVETIHDLVLARLFDFEELYRAARTWRVTDGKAVPWIREMADLSLAVAVDVRKETPVK